MKTKLCNRCALIKSVDCFYPHRCVCKQCCITRSLQNTKKKLAELTPEMRKIFYKKNNLAKYHITLSQFNEQLIIQDNCCGSCKKKFGKNRIPHADHSHSTHKFRGLLCQKCNTFIGKAHENIDVLRRAIAYLTNIGVFL